MPSSTPIPSHPIHPTTSSPPTTTWRPITIPNHPQPFHDILFEHHKNTIAKITINRPHVLNAFRPQTLSELETSFIHVRQTPSLRIVILTGAGTKAFCSGGDHDARGHGGYVGDDGVARLSVLDLHVMIRRLPKVVIAMVAGYAVGGGHILHLVCDLSIAGDNARFGQVGPKVGSFDGGYGSSYLSRIVGQKKAREIWFLCRLYDAKEAERMGLVNKIVKVEELERVTLEWCWEILEKSPTAIACIKAAMNADGDGHGGLSQLAGEATRLFYQSEESKEGSRAFKEKRKPRFDLYADGGKNAKVLHDASWNPRRRNARL